MSNGVDKIILGFVGPIAAGKSTVIDYLKTKYNAVGYRFSAPLRDILNRIYLETNRNNMQELSTALRQAFGDDLLASIIAHDVTKATHQLVLVDGVRREPDIRFLKNIKGFHLIAITADQKIRWQRMTRRSENPDDTKKTFAEFISDEQKEAEQQITTVAKLAKFKIDNNGSIEELYRQIDEILNRIKK